MTKQEFAKIVGKDLVVDYPFFGEVQQWSMKNFYFDNTGKIQHKRLPLIMDAFIENARNPHIGTATHG
jgi:hypothetical protein